MRLLKLLAYGLVAYAGYQFYKGYSSGQFSFGRGGGGGDSPAAEADRERQALGSRPDDQGQEGPGVGAAAVTGATGGGTVGGGGVGGPINDTTSDRGMPIETYEARGASVHHRVGRGVVTGP